MMLYKPDGTFDHIVILIIIFLNLDFQMMHLPTPNQCKKTPCRRMLRFVQFQFWMIWVWFTSLLNFVRVSTENKLVWINKGYPFLKFHFASFVYHVYRLQQNSRFY